MSAIILDLKMTCDHIDNLNNLYKQVLQNLQQSKNENYNKNVVRVQKASDEIFKSCIKNLPEKILQASTFGKQSLILLYAKPFEKYMNVSIVFICLGTKQEKEKALEDLKIISLKNQLDEHFKETLFRYLIRCSRDRSITIELFWG